MNEVAAFFDVDETIINFKSMFSFYEYWCKEKGLLTQYSEYTSRLKQDMQSGKRRELLNKDYYQQFTHVPLDALKKSGQEWFQQCLNKNIFISETISELRFHQKNGITPVFVSGSMLPVLQPIADYLGVKNIICAPLIINEEGVLTGKIGTPQTIGSGKKEALLSFCDENDIRAEDCYAYGDDISDIPMLEATGHPVCVGKNIRLMDYAALKGWRNI